MPGTTLENIELHGERVSLLPLTAEVDKEQLYRATQDERIWRYLPTKIDSKADLEAFVASALEGKARGLEYPFIVIDRETNRIVGSTRLLNLTLPHRNLEIGWTWFNPEVWRTRVNTECKYLLLRYGFEELGLIRVQLKADTRNDRSNAAIARIGATREGELRQDRVMHDGYVRNAYIYSILDSEWPAVKVTLEKYLNPDNGK